MSEKIFETITNLRLRTLAQRGTIRNYRKGSILIEEGDLGNTLYIVLKGRLKAYSNNHHANDREITFGVYGVGDLVGEMSLDDGPRSASVSAFEPTTCAVVTKETVRHYIAEAPDFAFDLLARVIARARTATHSARSMALVDAYGRLTEFLISLAVPQPDGTSLVGERLAHQEIANRIGCSREMVSRLIKDLEMGGYLDQSDRKSLRLLKNPPVRW